MRNSSCMAPAGHPAPGLPALGRRGYSVSLDPNLARFELLQDLKARFGDKITLIVRSDAAVDAAEVGDGGDRWAEVRGHLCELAIDLHQAISNFICCPS